MVRFSFELKNRFSSEEGSRSGETPTTLWNCVRISKTKKIYFKGISQSWFSLFSRCPQWRQMPFCLTCRFHFGVCLLSSIALMTSIRGKNKWPTSFCQAGHCCFYHILSTFLITGQKKGRMECIRFSWKLMHIQAVWYFSRKSNFFLLLIPTLVFPYSFSQTFQNDFTFQIWKKNFFF